jgi:sulfoxide reductase catalytic subunit YedY
MGGRIPHLRHLPRMSNLILRPDWSLPERLVTPERAVRNRRQFLQQLSLAGAAGLLTSCKPNSANGSLAESKPQTQTAAPRPLPGIPAARNAEFNPGWPLTNENIAANYNNFYEFSSSKERVAKLVGKFVVDPWTIEIGGMVEKPMKLDARELLAQFTPEERVYRFRCVEAWAMIVPWTGFPLRQLIEKVQPKAEAKFVKFVSARVPDQMPGIAMHSSYPWPYTEGLRMDEAMNELVLLASGIYGKALPKQHGAPLRIIIPWKYGFKGAKSVVRIEFVAKQPETFWETLAPDEYPFESNVDPAVPHPRWSQATERMIDTDDRVRTLPFNGYGKYVAALYHKA